MNKNSSLSQQLSLVSERKQELDIQLENYLHRIEQLQKDKQDIQSHLLLKEKEIKDLNTNQLSVKDIVAQQSKQLLFYQQQINDIRSQHQQKIQLERSQVQEQFNKFRDELQKTFQVEQANSLVVTAIKELITQLSKLRKRIKYKDPDSLLQSNTVIQKINSLLIEQHNNSTIVSLQKCQFEWQSKYFAQKLIVTEQLLDKYITDYRHEERVNFECEKVHKEQLSLTKSQLESQFEIVKSQLTTLTNYYSQIMQELSQSQVLRSHLEKENELLLEKQKQTNLQLEKYEIEKQNLMIEHKDQFQSELQLELDQRDVTLKQYFDNEIIKVITYSPFTDNVKLQTLSRQLISFQLNQHQLLSQFLHLQKKYDTLKIQLASLKQTQFQIDTQTKSQSHVIVAPSIESLLEFFKLQQELLQATHQNEKLQFELEKLNLNKKEEHLETSTQLQSIQDDLYKKYEKEMQQLNQQLNVIKEQHNNQLNTLRSQYSNEKVNPTF